jgi:hypothetical protein
MLDIVGSGDPTNPLSREIIAMGHFHVARMLDALNRTAEGLESARKAVAMREELASADTTNSWRRWYLIQAATKAALRIAKAGGRNAALEACRKAQMLLEVKTDDPTNVSQTAVRANAYSDLAWAYTILASDKEIALDQSREQWTTARKFYQEGLDIWLQLRTNGTLPGAYADEPDKLGRKIARCDAAIAAAQDKKY